ncbi:MAG: alpha/beta hydrolase [Pseudomonadota bacterium]
MSSQPNEAPAPQEVSFESGGAICRAWHFLPRNESMAKYRRFPCIVMGHGFGGTRDAGLVPYAQRFAAAGMHVVIFDYRHFGASDGEPRQLIAIEKQLQDWSAATAFARQLQDVDPSRVAIWGSSFSGGHVVETAFADRRVAAVIAQCPALDGFTNLRARLRYAGIMSGLRLLLAAVRDKLRALFRRAPVMLAIFGPPGSLAFLSSSDSETGYGALVPAGWRNETPARIALAFPFYRPIKHLYGVTCPLLLQFCTRDVLAPPAAIDLSQQQRGRRTIVVKDYDCGHFDLYRGEWFEMAIADQIAFLRTVFS